MPPRSGYRLIAAHFRRLVSTGALPPGSALPTQGEVAELFTASSKTVARAWKQMNNEGLIVTNGRGGTLVAEATSSNTASRVALHAATGKALADGETSRILDVGTVGADEQVARRLDVEPGTPVHVRRRLVSRGDRPLHVSSSYYPDYVIAVTPELTQPVSTGGSRELAAQRLGSAQAHALEEVTSRPALTSEKDALGLSAGDVTVTQVMRVVFLADGRVVEVAVKVTSGSTVLRWSTSLKA